MKILYLGFLAYFLLMGFLFAGKPRQYNIIDATFPVVYPYENISFALAQEYKIIINDKTFTVPSNFVTDLASIPRIFWFLFPPHDARTFAPSVLHDYFYSGLIKVNRKFADDVFYSHMIESDCSKYKAYMFWFGVRFFGWIHFKELKK